MSRVVAQFSCGAASAVATKMALSQHKGAEVVIVNAFLKEEDDDNRRFLADCEDWFAQKAVQLRDEKYGASADEVWRRKNYMKGPHGAPCSGELKRKVIDKTGGAIAIVAKVTDKTPEAPPDADLLWATVEGSLSYDNPSQQKLDLQPVAGTERRIAGA